MLLKDFIETKILKNDYSNKNLNDRKESYTNDNSTTV